MLLLLLTFVQLLSSAAWTSEAPQAAAVPNSGNSKETFFAHLALKSSLMAERGGSWKTRGMCLLHCAVLSFDTSPTVRSGEQQEASSACISSCRESTKNNRSMVEIRVVLSDDDFTVADARSTSSNHFSCRLQLWKRFTRKHAAAAVLFTRAVAPSVVGTNDAETICDEIRESAQEMSSQWQAVGSADPPRREVMVDEAVMDHFPPLSEIEDRMDQLGQRFGSSLVRPFVLPIKTVEGRAIRGVCVGGRQSLGFESRRSLPRPVTALIVGTHHAREWISATVALSITEKFAEALFSSQGETGDIMSNTSLEWRSLALFGLPVELCAIPVLNPDGYAFTFEAGEDEQGGDKRYWRKNRRPCVGDEGTRGGSSSSSTHLVGTDLNRNYAVDWNDNGGSSPYCDSDTYRGPSAYSEREVAGLIQWLAEEEHVRSGPDSRSADQPPDQRGWTWLDAFLSYHSFGNDILYPLGYSTTIFGKNEPLLHDIASLMQSAILQDTGASYDVLKAAGSYPVSGDTVDDIHLSFGSIPAYTIETRPSARDCCGFVLAASQIAPAVSENFAALRELLTYVSAVRSAATSSTTSTVDWAKHLINRTLYAGVKSDLLQMRLNGSACPSLVGLVNVIDGGSEDGELFGIAEGDKKNVSWRPERATFSSTESFVMEASLPIWGAGQLNAASARHFLLDLFSSALEEENPIVTQDILDEIDVSVLAVMPLLSEESARVVFQLVRRKRYDSGVLLDGGRICDMELLVLYLATGLSEDVNIVMFSMDETVNLLSRLSAS